MSVHEAPCQTEELGHTSEIGLRARAATTADLFGCLARAMIALTGVRADEGAELMTLEVDVQSVDLESLLVDWLNEVLYLHEVTRVVPEQVTVQAITPTTVEATLSGRASSAPSDLQIKAVTYHQLAIGQENDEWKAEVFFDI